MGLTKKQHFTPDENYIAQILRCLAHPCRLRIIVTLLIRDLTVGQMTADFAGPAQSTVSEHIRFLKNEGLVVGTQVNNTIIYSLNRVIWQHIKWVLVTVADDNELMLMNR